MGAVLFTGADGDNEARVAIEACPNVGGDHLFESAGIGRV